MRGCPVNQATAMLEIDQAHEIEDNKSQVLRTVAYMLDLQAVSNLLGLLKH